MKHRIDVTAEDIALGQPSDPCWCPVAIAIRRALRITDARSVIVTGNRAAIGDGRAVLPPEVLAFINEFDSEQPVQPFGFEIGDGVYP